MCLLSNRGLSYISFPTSDQKITLGAVCDYDKRQLKKFTNVCGCFVCIISMSLFGTCRLYGDRQKSDNGASCRSLMAESLGSFTCIMS